MTLGHQERLGDVVAGHGTDVDLVVIRAWWSLRSLRAVSWLAEHGFDPSAPGCDVDVQPTVAKMADSDDISNTLAVQARWGGWGSNPPAAWSRA